MKHAKKLLAALLALAMMLAMAVPAFADDAQKGTIEINDAIPGTTYTAYKIFDLSYTPASGDKAASYSYTVADGWADFVNGTEGSKYVEVKGGNVVAKDSFTDKSEAAAAFAKAALAYAEEHLKGKGVSQTAPAAAAGSEYSSVSITGLDLGYYVVSTSAGSLCSLGTTATTATIEEKNEAPEIDKTVKAGSEYKDSNSANIGDTVEFKVTIDVKKGATNYVLNDTLSDGLTLNAGSIQVVSTKNDKLTENTDYTVTANVEDGTLKVEFKDSALVEDDTLTVTYNAVLNEKAQTGKNDPNTNSAQLTYGNNNKTTSETTKTYTYEFDIVKTDGDKNLLTGAQFQLYTVQTDGTPVKFVKDGTTYRVAKTGEDGATDTIEAGHVVIKGLAAGTYWLEETKAPFSYNKLTDRQSFEVKEDNNHATLTSDGKYSEGGMRVINQSGTTLPSTGGIGTTIFYVVGGGLMVAAAVLLITKKRMENKNN